MISAAHTRVRNPRKACVHSEQAQEGIVHRIIKNDAVRLRRGQPGYNTLEESLQMQKKRQTRLGAGASRGRFVLTNFHHKIRHADPGTVHGAPQNQGQKTPRLLVQKKNGKM